MNPVDFLWNQHKEKLLNCNGYVITGGFSYLFKKSIKSKVIIDKDITIKGLIYLVKALKI